MLGIAVAASCVAGGLGRAHHAYRGEAPDGPRPAECGRYDGQALPFAGERHPWPEAVRGADRADVLYGTAYAQRIIWEHQHPQRCDGAKFLALRSWPIGMGALLHMLARALGLAMRLGRILVFAEEALGERSMAMWPGPGGMPWYDERLCEGARSWECWFQPIASCAPGPGSDLRTVWGSDLERRRSDDFTSHYTPPPLQHLLRNCSRVKRRMELYWWHAQAIAFIVRFNPRTRRLLDDLRSRLLQVQARSRRRPSKAPSGLPPGAIAVHVRHGDKGAEMPLEPFARHASAAEGLAAGDALPVLPPGLGGGVVYAFPAWRFAGRTMFLSTEDPEVVTEALAWGRAAWSVVHFRENRTNADVATMRRQRGYGRATLQSFLNLEAALEADAWVCTLTSNWCQLIDELRSTVGGKASAPFVNLAHAGYRHTAECVVFQNCPEKPRRQSPPACSAVRLAPGRDHGGSRRPTKRKLE